MLQDGREQVHTWAAVDKSRAGFPDDLEIQCKPYPIWTVSQTDNITALIEPGDYTIETDGKVVSVVSSVVHLESVQ